MFKILNKQRRKWYLKDLLLIDDNRAEIIQKTRGAHRIYCSSVHERRKLFGNNIVRTNLQSLLFKSLAETSNVSYRAPTKIHYLICQDFPTNRHFVFDHSLIFKRPSSSGGKLQHELMKNADNCKVLKAHSNCY